MNITFIQECFIYPRTYVPGETATFEKAQAARLINEGIASPARESATLNTSELPVSLETADKPNVSRPKKQASTEES